MAYPSITLFNKAINNQVFATKIKVIVTNAHVVGQEEVMRNKRENAEWGRVNAECGMRNRECGMGNRECGMGNGEWGMRNGINIDFLHRPIPHSFVTYSLFCFSITDLFFFLK